MKKMTCHETGILASLHIGEPYKFRRKLLVKVRHEGLDKCRHCCVFSYCRYQQTLHHWNAPCYLQSAIFKWAADVIGED